MTFTCPYFSPAVMVKFNEKGDGTLCDSYLNEHASNHTHIWTYLLDCEHSLFCCSRIILLNVATCRSSLIIRFITMVAIPKGMTLQRFPTIAYSDNRISPSLTLLK